VSATRVKVTGGEPREPTPSAHAPGVAAPQLLAINDPYLSGRSPVVCRVFSLLTGTARPPPPSTLPGLSPAGEEAGASTVEIRISALRFLYKRVLRRRDFTHDDLIFPKVPVKLPMVLSQEEVARLIDAAPSRLYRMLIVLLYATGLRRTEASLIKVEDIDSKRMVIHIRQGKGARDRDVPLSPKLLEELRSYWRWKKPRGYLFPSTAGQRGVDQPISDKTIWNACRVAATPRTDQENSSTHAAP
jgi:integrase